MIRDINRIRDDFPILKTVKAFLDSAASCQKPQSVIDTVTYYMQTKYANVHRGMYGLSTDMTRAYEAARHKVADFLHADVDQIIFTKSATEAINLVAYSFGSLLQKGDEIILSEMEHHANIVPWQLLRERRGVVLRICPILDDGALDMESFSGFLNKKTALVAITHVSNVLGTIVDIKDLAQKTHVVGAKILVDGSQGVVHQAVHIDDSDVDFYCFTGHKIYAPTGIGVLVAKKDILQRMPPFMGGGDMIENVSFADTTFSKGVAKFEAGTPPIVQAIGLGAAIDYIETVGFTAIALLEKQLYKYLLERLITIKGVRIIGSMVEKAPIISFVMNPFHPFDVAEILCNQGICVRVGHHCAQPLMERFKVEGTVRVSLAMYNTMRDIDVFIDALHKAERMLS